MRGVYFSLSKFSAFMQKFNSMQRMYYSVCVKSNKNEQMEDEEQLEENDSEQKSLVVTPEEANETGIMDWVYCLQSQLNINEHFPNLPSVKLGMKDFNIDALPKKFLLLNQLKKYGLPVPDGILMNFQLICFELLKIFDGNKEELISALKSYCTKKSKPKFYREVFCGEYEFDIDEEKIAQFQKVEAKLMFIFNCVKKNLSSSSAFIRPGDDDDKRDSGRTDSFEMVTVTDIIRALVSLLENKNNFDRSKRVDKLIQSDPLKTDTNFFHRNVLEIPNPGDYLLFQNKCALPQKGTIIDKNGYIEFIFSDQEQCHSLLTDNVKTIIYDKRTKKYESKNYIKGFLGNPKVKAHLEQLIEMMGKTISVLQKINPLFTEVQVEIGCDELGKKGFKVNILQAKSYTNLSDANLSKIPPHPSKKIFHIDDNFKERPYKVVIVTDLKQLKNMDKDTLAIIDLTALKNKKDEDIFIPPGGGPGIVFTYGGVHGSHPITVLSGSCFLVKEVSEKELEVLKKFANENKGKGSVRVYEDECENIAFELLPDLKITPQNKQKEYIKPVELRIRKDIDQKYNEQKNKTRERQKDEIYINPNYKAQEFTLIRVPDSLNDFDYTKSGDIAEIYIDGITYIIMGLSRQKGTDPSKYYGHVIFNQFKAVSSEDAEKIWFRLEELGLIIESDYHTGVGVVNKQAFRNNFDLGGKLSQYNDAIARILRDAGHFSFDPSQYESLDNESITEYFFKSGLERNFLVSGKRIIGCNSLFSHGILQSWARAKDLDLSDLVRMSYKDNKVHVYIHDQREGNKTYSEEALYRAFCTLKRQGVDLVEDLDIVEILAASHDEFNRFKLAQLMLNDPQFTIQDVFFVLDIAIVENVYDSVTGKYYNLAVPFSFYKRALDILKHNKNGVSQKLIGEIIKRDLPTHEKKPFDLFKLDSKWLHEKCKITSCPKHLQNIVFACPKYYYDFKNDRTVTNAFRFFEQVKTLKDVKDTKKILLTLIKEEKLEEVDRLLPGIKYCDYAKVIPRILKYAAQRKKTNLIKQVKDHILNRCDINIFTKEDQVIIFDSMTDAYHKSNKQVPKELRDFIVKSDKLSKNADEIFNKIYTFYLEEKEYEEAWVFHRMLLENSKPFAELDVLLEKPITNFLANEIIDFFAKNQVSCNSKYKFCEDIGSYLIKTRNVELALKFYNLILKADEEIRGSMAFSKEFFKMIIKEKPSSAFNVLQNTLRFSINSNNNRQNFLLPLYEALFGMKGLSERISYICSFYQAFPLNYCIIGECLMVYLRNFLVELTPDISVMIKSIKSKEHKKSVLRNIFLYGSYDPYYQREEHDKKAKEIRQLLPILIEAFPDMDELIIEIGEIDVFYGYIAALLEHKEYDRYEEFVSLIPEKRMNWLRALKTVEEKFPDYNKKS
ncbi:hypothetical protein ACFLZV_02505 [Candidatus Margulisiibacteriota bacterium]